MRRILAPALLGWTALAADASAQSTREPGYQSYLAHVAAAGASLRLYETSEATR